MSHKLTLPELHSFQSYRLRPGVIGQVIEVLENGVILQTPDGVLLASFSDLFPATEAALQQMLTSGLIKEKDDHVTD